MSLFLSDEELRLLSDDAAAVVERADGAIRDLRCQLDTVRAEADAAAIAAEQNCALLEQRYETLSSDLARVRSENAQLSASLEKRLSEIADAQAEKHQLHLKAVRPSSFVSFSSLALFLISFFVEKGSFLKAVGPSSSTLIVAPFFFVSFLFLGSPLFFLVFVSLFLCCF